MAPQGGPTAASAHCGRPTGASGSARARRTDRPPRSPRRGRGETPRSASGGPSARTAEAAAVEDSVDVLDRALLRKQVTLEDVVAAHERYPGRRGATTAGRIVAAATGGARSEAERIAHRLLRRASIGGWEANADAAGYLCDIVFEAVRVVVEIDGFAFHTDPEAFRRDREKRNALVAAGWTVLHFTWRDVTERPGYVVASIRRAIRSDSSR